MKVDFYHYNFHETINWENIYKALLKLGADAQFIVEAPDTNTSRTLSWDGYKRITSYMHLRNYPYLPRPRYEDADAAITTQRIKWLQNYKGLKINSLYGSTLTKDAAGYRKAKLAGFDGILAHGPYTKHRIITNGISAEKIAIMGFPKYVDYFRSNVKRQEWQEIFNLNPEKKTIVYIPSWHRNSSIDAFLDTISGLSEEFNVLIKPHHNNLEMEQKRILKMQHLNNVFLQDLPCSSVPFYVVGDIVIADTRSGAFAEGVLTNSRLIGLHIRDNTQADFVEPVVYQLAPICETPGQLIEAINEFANPGTDKYQAIKEFIKPYLFTDFQGNDDLEAAKAIIKFIEQKKRTTATIGSISTPKHSAGLVQRQTVTIPADKQVSQTASELDSTIPPEIKNDEFYFLIQKLAQQESVKTILEIGSSSGTGSTEAFVKGLHQNPNKPTLFCMEISKPRFAELQNRYAAESNVKCYNISSVSLDKFPSEQEVSSFYFNIKTTLNNYPIERVLGWLRQDIEYMKSSGHCENGIQIIKEENNIKNFDMVLIDGSAFTGTAEFNEIYGTGLILLDDINSFKNYDNYKRLMKDPDYALVEENWRLRNGYAAFRKLTTTPDNHTSVKSALKHTEGLLRFGQAESPFKLKSLSEDPAIIGMTADKNHNSVFGDTASPIVKNAGFNTKPSKKLRLLLVYSLHPVTPRITLPEWIKEVLRKHYASEVEVFACGPGNEINTPDSPDFYNKVAKIVKDLDIDAIWDIEGGAVSKDFMFKRFPRQISIPKLWWAIDTHQFLPLMVEKARFFDVIFSAQKNAVPALGPKALWLPAGASIHEVDYQLERTIDVGFIGHISPKVHQRRKKIIERLQKEIDGFRCFKNVFLREKAELASQMKIMVNVSLKNDINFRVFETLACGAMLITDKIYNNGFEELFEDGKHLVTFETEEELIDKIHYYLKHEDQRERIARAGQQRVLQQFTHRVLLRKPLDIIAKLVEQHRQKTQQTGPTSIGKTARCWCNGQLKESVHPLYGQCQTCGTLVLAKQLTKDQLKEFYTFDKYWHNHVVNVSGHPPIEQRATNDFRDRIPVWHKLLRKYKPKIENLLEIGCAHGGFLHYCRERGVKNVVGIEPDEQTCEFVRRYFNLPYVISGLFPDVSLPFKKFDVVTGFDVIEHFLDPVKAMQKVADLLEDDGIYLFQIPCYRGEGREWVQFRPNEHIFLYNSQSIRRLFNRAGLEVTEILPGYFRDDIFVIGCKKLIRNLLFVRTDSIGDNVLAASMLQYIRQKYKDAKITVVCQEHIAELYETCPYIDDIIAFNRKRALEDRQYRQEIINRLRALKPDLSLNSVFSREPLTDVLAIECGAEQRAALEGDLSNISAEVRQKHNQFYSKLLPSEGKHKLEMDRHKDFLRGLCIDVPSLKPAVWISSEDEKLADSFFRKHNLNPDKTIALFAGAQYEVRLYEKYGKSLSEICKKNQFNVIALGSKSEHGTNQRNLDDIGVRTFNLSGETTICQSAAILKRCKLSVGAETGLAHISCAVKTPNVILLGGGHFGRFMPYSPLTSIVCLPLQCYGCNWRCSNQRVYCIRGIRPEVITEAIRRSLAGSSKKPRVFVQDTSLWKPKPGQPQWKLFGDFLNIGDAEVIPVGQTVLGIEQTSQSGVQSSESEYLVTAIVSTYNSERFIRSCLEDLEKQTIADKLEIIVVNSGSQENEEAIIREFQQKYDNINYIKTEQKEGLYKAWNRAIKAASGKYITNANTDDRHRKDAFEVLSNALEEHPKISLVYADCYVSSIQNENSKRYIYRYPDFFPVAAALHYQFGPQPMWRKNIHDTIGYFDESYRAIGDYDFNLRFALHLKAMHIAEPLGLYLERPTSITFRDDTRLQEHKRIALTYRNAEIIEQLYKQVGIACDTPQEKAQVHLDIGLRALEYYPPWRMGKPECNLKFALQCFQRAVKWKPGWAAAYNNFAIVLALIGNFQNAAKVLGRISRLTQDPIIDYNFKLISEFLSSGRIRSDAKLIPSGLALPSQSQISLKQKSPNEPRHYTKVFVDR
jgi:ADP-heptose:LPS heptosyltransferase/glycosyltransferase involved in cell wall biosynthesis/tRNA G46 methylase TrmB